MRSGAGPLDDFTGVLSTEEIRRRLHDDEDTLAYRGSMPLAVVWLTLWGTMGGLFGRPAGERPPVETLVGGGRLPCRPAGDVAGHAPPLDPADGTRHPVDRDIWLLALPLGGAGTALAVICLHNDAPDLCIEVLSPSTRDTDRGRKMQVFARYGVREDRSPRPCCPA